MSFSQPPPPPSHLGDTIPALTPHAVSVALPTWQDNVDYEEGAQRVKDAMTSGYPRFFIHHLIDRLAQISIAKFGKPNELALLLPSKKTALACQAFLSDRSSPVTSRLIPYPISSAPDASLAESDPTASSSSTTSDTRVITVYIVFVPADDFPIAKQFWQHTGDGISSRFAERCLALLGVSDDSNPTSPELKNSDISLGASKPTNGAGGGGRYQSKVKRYATSVASALTASTASTSTTTPSSSKSGTSTPTSRYSTNTSILSSSSSSQHHHHQQNGDEPDSLTSSVDSLPPRRGSHPALFSELHPNNNISSSLPAAVEQEEDVLSRYVEERYGRNLDLSLAPLAKLAMRRRIAGVLRERPGEPVEVSRIDRVQNGVSDRGVEGLTEEGVWLYPTGMSAIWHAHQLAMGARRAEGVEVGKTCCFGFPYTDTLKILEKWGPGVHFLGHGLSSDLPALRTLAETSSPPLVAVFCEFPSNPLLRTPPLRELRTLADEFGFLIVVDETIAGFVNVETLPWADVVVSSLTKVFSGDCNVMGGSLVINPKSTHFAALKAFQEAEYEDHYFDEDAIYMERNSRDFQYRIAQMNHSTETICDFLRSRRHPGPYATGIAPPPSSPEPPQGLAGSSVIKEVYYPKFMTPEHYLASLRMENPNLPHASGFGALFSLTFTSALASRVFFDALGCYKGPSLGTNFTIACPYTILAHYTELDWVREWGVDKGLVRISVGLEELELLKEWFEGALDKAEQAVQDALA